MFAVQLSGILKIRSKDIPLESRLGVLAISQILTDDSQKLSSSTLKKFTY